MYKLDETVWTQIKDNVMSWYRNAWLEYFPWHSFSLFVIQFVFVGFLGGLLVKLLSPRKWSNPNPEYY